MPVVYRRGLESDADDDDMEGVGGETNDESAREDEEEEMRGATLEVEEEEVEGKRRIAGGLEPESNSTL